MIKKAILVIMFLSFFVPNFVVAQNSNQEGKIYKNISDFSNLIPTVKIVSYDYGYSGGVYPSQFGSGSIISADGFILTNYHVVFDAEDEDKALDAFEICFSFNSGSEPICEYTASLVASYKEKDLALLKLDEADIRGNSFKNVPFYTYQKDKELKVGDTIKIIGYPGTGGDTLTTTQGVISGFSEAEDSQEPLTYIKSDADISEGSSGGTTVDEQGNITASGSATFAKLNISGMDDATATVSATSSATIGEATMSAGVKTISIETTAVTDQSLIYVTPQSSTNNQVLYVKTKTPGIGFTVNIDTAISKDVKFNWWIVN
ncbi:MAG: hypothetical protein UR27_C0012G0005 [Candidatus Peregrinibacteria bacterium GW2011_GWA2_33_10]|nr:MAG: hypothetical protein UR27_C0012G0005 [Candidatus Peregrinibacteria bacterium GW2011_GWA2_33_10]